MAENIISRSFNAIAIHQKVKDGYINLNQMANATGRRIDNWNRLDETTSLLREFKLDPQYKNLEPIVAVPGRTGGTWAHPDIAIQFAQWCSPAFALQVSRWVRKWITTDNNPLVDADRVGLKSGLKDESRLRMTDEVKVYLEQIKKYDDKRYRGIYFARVHDSINKLVTTETSKQMKDRLGAIVGKKIKETELIRDYFPIDPLQKYIALCESSANYMLKEGLEPLAAVEKAADMFLPANYEAKPIDFVEHIKFVRQRLEGQGQMFLD